MQSISIIIFMTIFVAMGVAAPLAKENNDLRVSGIMMEKRIPTPADSDIEREDIAIGGIL